VKLNRDGNRTEFEIVGDRTEPEQATSEITGTISKTEDFGACTNESLLCTT